MNRIIGVQTRSAANLGGKGFSLLGLDELGLTPNFLIISVSVFNEYVKRDKELSAWLRGGSLDKKDLRRIREKVMRFRPDARTSRDILAAVDRLGMRGFMVRSSCAVEDSPSASYAGLFTSQLCYKKSDIFNCIKRVWASQFLERVAAYRQCRGGSAGGMAVVVQQFVAPDYSGTCFVNSIRPEEIYVEYCEKSHDAVELGKVRPDFFLQREGWRYFGGEQSARSYWQNDLVKAVARLRACLPGALLDIEFVVAKGRVYLIQSRPLTRKLNTAAMFFVLPFWGKCGYSFEDFSAGIFQGMLKSRLLIEKKKNGVGMSGGAWFKLADELDRKTLDPNFINRFCRRFLEVLLEECGKTRSAKDQGLEALFLRLKNLNFKMSVFDWLHLRLQRGLEGHLVGKHGRKWWAKNIESFTPVISFASEQLLGLLDGSKSPPPFINKEEMEKTLRHLRAAGDVDVLRRKIQSKKDRKIKKDLKLTGDLAEYSAPFRALVDLRDRVDHYYGIISAVYHARIKESKAFRGDIEQACRIPIGELMRVIRAGKCVAQARNKGKEEVEFGALKFPLRGTVACAGDIKGRVRMVTKCSDAMRLTADDVLVARYTRPELFMGMLVCKGIITEEGGETSHAAIVSREIGKPCLVGVDGCTRLLKDGDMVRTAGDKVYRAK